VSLAYPDGRINTLASVNDQKGARDCDEYPSGKNYRQGIRKGEWRKRFALFFDIKRGNTARTRDLGVDAMNGKILKICAGGTESGLTGNCA
jgi:hypothetical protein